MQPVHEILNETALKSAAPALPRPVSGMDHLFKKLLVFIPLGIIGNILFFFLAGDNDPNATLANLTRANRNQHLPQSHTLHSFMAALLQEQATMPLVNAGRRRRL